MRWLADVPVDPDEARRRAAEILQGADFRPPRRSVLERVLGWIGEQLARLFGTLGGGGGGAVVGWIVVTAVVAGLVALVVVGLRRARGGAAAPTDDTVVETVARTSAQVWRERAAEHAAAGRWREALRCRYRAVEAELDERGLIAAAPGTTTGAERAQVAERAPALAEPFADVSAAFDLGVYGGDPLGPDALARADELDRTLATLTAARRDAAPDTGDDAPAGTGG